MYQSTSLFGSATSTTHSSGTVSLPAAALAALLSASYATTAASASFAALPPGAEGRGDGSRRMRWIGMEKMG